MSSGATLVGFEEVIRNLEAKLGDEKVRRSANKALKGAATETLEDFKGTKILARQSQVRLSGMSLEVLKVSQWLSLDLVLVHVGAWST